jgi:hypothetical protein
MAPAKAANVATGIFFSFFLSFGGSKRNDIEVEKLLSSSDVPDKKYQENTLR